MPSKKPGNWPSYRWKIRRPNNNCEKLIGFLSENKDNQFSMREMSVATGVSMNTTGNFLTRNFKRGYLSRTGDPKKVSTLDGGYQYRLCLAEKLPPRYLSKGEVALAVWKILRKTTRPLSKNEIYEITQAKGSTFSLGNINVIILRWLRDGRLIQEGDKKDKKFRLQPELTKRFSGRPSATGFQSSQKVLATATIH